MDLKKHIANADEALRELTAIEKPNDLQRQARIRATTFLRALNQCAQEAAAEENAVAEIVAATSSAPAPAARKAAKAQTPAAN